MAQILHSPIEGSNCELIENEGDIAHDSLFVLTDKLMPSFRWFARNAAVGGSFNIESFMSSSS